MEKTPNNSWSPLEIDYWVPESWCDIVPQSWQPYHDAMMRWIKQNLANLCSVLFISRHPWHDFGRNVLFNLRLNPLTSFNAVFMIRCNCLGDDASPSYSNRQLTLGSAEQSVSSLLQTVKQKYGNKFNMINSRDRILKAELRVVHGDCYGLVSQLLRMIRYLFCYFQGLIAGCGQV